MKHNFFLVLIWLFILSSCGDSEDSPTPTTLQDPVIISVNPTVATAGSSIEVAGSHFDSYATEQTIAFVKNGSETSATITNRTDSKLTVQVPNALTSGQYSIKLTWKQGSTTFEGFSVEEPEESQLTISRISPVDGEVGTIVTIEGTNFSTKVADNKVYFVSGQTSHEGVVKSATSTSIEVVVPDLELGPYDIKVVVNDETNFADQYFVVKGPAPVITEISPTETELQSVVTITGENFGTDPDYIRIGFTHDGSASYSYEFTLENGVITVELPYNLSAGVYNIYIEANGKEVTSTQTITVTEIVPPVVTAITPNSGRRLDKFQISGSNFGTDVSKVAVTLQGTYLVVATVTSVTDNLIECEVPDYGDAGDYLVKVSKKNVAATYSGARDFTMLPEIPVVSGMSPTSGTSGTEVTIEGSNFGTDLFGVEIDLGGGLTARVTSVKNNEIKATLPCDLSTGSIDLTLRQVSTNEEVAVGSFNVTEPTGTVAYCMVPNPVTRGEQLTIYGNDLTSTGVTNINIVPVDAPIGAVLSIPSSTDGGKTLSFTVPENWHAGTYRVIIQLSSGDVEVNGILEIK